MQWLICFNMQQVIELLMESVASQSCHAVVMEQMFWGRCFFFFVFFSKVSNYWLASSKQNRIVATTKPELSIASGIMICQSNQRKSAIEFAAKFECEIKNIWHKQREVELWAHQGKKSSRWGDDPIMPSFFHAELWGQCYDPGLFQLVRKNEQSWLTKRTEWKVLPYTFVVFPDRIRISQVDSARICQALIVKELMKSVKPIWLTSIQKHSDNLVQNQVLWHWMT